MKKPALVVFLSVLTLSLLSAGCDMIMKEKSNHKVTQIRTADSFVLKTEGDSMMDPDQYNVVEIMGVEFPSGDKSNTEARKFLETTLVGNYITYESVGYDAMGHMLAWVYVDGELLNAEMLRRGMGYFDLRGTVDKHRADLEAAEAEAKDAGRGMWQRYDERPTRNFWGGGY